MRPGAGASGATVGQAGPNASNPAIVSAPVNVSSTNGTVRSNQDQARIAVEKKACNDKHCKPKPNPKPKPCHDKHCSKPKPKPKPCHDKNPCHSK